MSIPIDLTQYLGTKTTQTLLRLGEEFGVDAETSTGLSWLLQVMKHIKETTYNFPSGKYTTIHAVESILTDISRRHVEIFYGRRN